jgi:tRNA(fMet)-specific endonuclease VapC
MSSPTYVLDTNTLSDVLRRNETVVAHFADALKRNALFILCPVVFYEVYRGLLHKGATRQIAALREFTGHFHYEDLSRDDWEEAAELWAELRRRGQQTADADLIIGVYASRRNATVVTSNVRDFAPFKASIENWRE